MKYKFLFLLGFIFVLFSCTDKELDLEPTVEQPPLDYSSGYSMDFVVTLDDMGGTRAGFNPLKDIENYIDPQKFRVFFFNEDEEFLFESKNRWLKKLTTNPEDLTNNVWYVSVPFFSFGNDEDDDWDWENIRTELTKGPFKIAIIANAPVLEYSNEYNTSNDVMTGNVKGWQRNNGPTWSKADSKYTDNGINESPKKIFDFHHSQTETIYKAKGMDSNYTYHPAEGAQPDPRAEGCYNFIMDNAGIGVYEPTDPQLSPFKSWVDWYGEDDDHRNQVYFFRQLDNNNEVISGREGTTARKTIVPSQENPIPMYGIQKFDEIKKEDWKAGSAYTLNRTNDEPVSLLRSVVKLDLVLPIERKPEWICLMYSNIYSRVQPMDVWTPTNEIWYTDESHTIHNDEYCEMNQIKEYGSLVSSNDSPTKDWDPYRERLSWIYGSWKAKGWTFGSFGTTKVREGGEGKSYPKNPQIFNPCIQRNVAVFLGGKVAGKSPYLDNLGHDTNNNMEEYTDNYYYEGDKLHVIVYTGERNIIDPSSLCRLNSSSGAGTNTLIYFALSYDNGGTIFTVPIADYGNTGNTSLTGITTRYYTCSGDASNLQAVTNYKVNSGKNIGNGVSEYSDYVIGTNADHDYMPYPLVRNHVYRLTMFGAGKSSIAAKTRSGEPVTLGETGIKSEVFYSPTISFPAAVKRLKENKPIEIDKVKKQ